MNDLAQELVDHIIDSRWILADEPPKAMKSCGLVCKRWLPRTRYHLFSAVCLTTYKAPYLVNLVESSPLPILSFIRHLTLRYWDYPPSTTYLARLHRCANLERIDIDIRSQSWVFNAAVDWLGSDALHVHLRSWSANSGSILRLTLAFHELGLLPWRTFAKIISCLPSVETLEVRNVGLLPATDTCPALFHPRITCLELITGFSVSFFSSFLSLPVLPMFESLKLDMTLAYGVDWSPITEYIERAGEGLQSLEILLWGRWGLACPDVTPFQQRVFAHTPMLRHLTFDVTSLSHLLHTLSSLPAMTSLTTLTVVIDTEKVRTDPACGALDAALAEPRFHSLQRFSLKSMYTHRIEPLSPATMSLLPLANARRILN
ncbi:hypothetical protein DFH09DRAFT_202770 [Mycena vulgaris]|nr:hypothetical protein DFH09DRAFT_202770 [Mycena vulgaris]